jgi:hypothetical protein
MRRWEKKLPPLDQRHEEVGKKAAAVRSEMVRPDFICALAQNLFEHRKRIQAIPKS